MTANTSRDAASSSAVRTVGAGVPRRDDAIDQWLAMFTRFLHVSAEQKRSVRDELDSHVRERVRDLMLAGLNEDEGMRRAIDELGEAAELAAHFNAAHRSPRRTLMSIATIGVAASAAVISIFALAQAPAPQPKKNAEAAPAMKDVPLAGELFVRVPEAGEQLDRPVKLEGKVDNPTVRSLAAMLADAAGKRLSLNPGEFDVTRVLPAVELVDTDSAALMQLINERAQLSGPSRFDYRLRGDVLEIAPQRVFDKAETKLVAYDLTPVFSSQANGMELLETIATFVEPEGWRDNGGETAQMKIVGNRMFVQAPPRYHAGVAWILEQFGSPSRSRRSGAGGPLMLAAAMQRDAELAAREGAVARDAGQERINALRREIAWQKARLGDPLSQEEVGLLDNRAVHSPETAAAVAEARRQLEVLKAELEAVRRASASPAPPAPTGLAPAAESAAPAPKPAAAPEPR